MEFTFACTYDLRALKAMNRAMRRTVRKKRSRRTHIFGWILIVLIAVLIWRDIAEGTFAARSVITLIAGAAMLIVLLFEDHLNARISRRRMLSGIEKVTAVFTPDGYVSRSEAGMSEWKYSRIRTVAETKDYFVFALDENYGQVYAKSGLSGGTAEEFAAFIAEATGIPVDRIK